MSSEYDVCVCVCSVDRAGSGGRVVKSYACTQIMTITTKLPIGFYCFHPNPNLRVFHSRQSFVRTSAFLLVELNYGTHHQRTW